jgi:hypothetical protein
MNQKYRTKVDQEDAAGMMQLFEVINAGGNQGEMNEIVNQGMDGEESSNPHSLVCNNELFNKELWAIVDDTVHEE